MAQGRVVAVDATSAQTVEAVGAGTDSPPGYLLDETGWEALSIDEKVSAVSEYAATTHCTRDRVAAIAVAIRDETFVVLDDSVESTLTVWCKPETEDDEISASEALDVEKADWFAYSHEHKLKVVKQYVADTGCDLQAATSGSYIKFVDYIDSQMRTAFPGVRRTALGRAEWLCGFR